MLSKNSINVNLNGFQEGSDADKNLIFVKNLKKNVSEGAVKYTTVKNLNLDYVPSNVENIEAVFNSFKKNEVFFKKNEKQVLKGLEDVSLEANL